MHAIFTYFNNDPANVRNQDNLGGRRSFRYRLLLRGCGKNDF